MRHDIRKVYLPEKQRLLEKVSTTSPAKMLSYFDRLIFLIALTLFVHCTIVYYYFTLPNKPMCPLIKGLIIKNVGCPKNGV